MGRYDVNQIRSGAGRLARRTGRQLERSLGGQARTRVIVTLACVLALSSADAATVGAAASPLRSSLHIDNTDIGLLVTVSSLVAAVASLPFGVMADRWRRTRTLGVAIFTWGAAMLWSATASSFGRLLLARVVLGAVTAAAGPIVASLVGDYFEGSERGRIWSYILTGELLGAGVGFAVTGDLAALSWRAAFVLLALPAFVLAWYVLRLPEPVRGGRTPLLPDAQAASRAPGPAGPPGSSDPTHTAEEPGAPNPADDGPVHTDAQRLAAARGVVPDPDLVAGPDLADIRLIDAVRYVFRIRTNVILIVASACGYFYLSGIETFGAEFVKEQFRVNQALANLLLLVLGGGAVVGVLVAGSLSDSLLRRGFLNARILVAGVAAMGATVLFIPALTTRNAVAAVPYLTLAALMLSAQNPPIDAGRLDIVPALLWGRAEAIRTVVRSLAQSLAPVLFGVVSDHLFGGGRGGLQWTFAIMLITMAGSGVILMRALRTYPRDVATAAAAAPARATPAASAPSRTGSPATGSPATGSPVPAPAKAAPAPPPAAGPVWPKPAPPAPAPRETG
jgi:MFS family permease